MASLSNSEIIKIYVDNGLIERCIQYQFSKLKEPWKGQFSGDMYNDLIIIMQEYDNGKLNNAHANNHMNAWITRVLQNNLYSDHSNFYIRYLRFLNKCNEIPVEEDDMEEDDEHD